MFTISSQEGQQPAKEPGSNGKIVVLNSDLFFGVKIGNILRGLGYMVVFAKTTPAFVDLMTRGAAEVVLGIVDINAGVDWSAIADLTGASMTSASLLAFGSHLDVDGLRAAKAAGVRRVVSNGDFHRDMVKLVARYASPEINIDTESVDDVIS